ncbi:hypothetical protein BX616_003724 [Lobosporangium transversale]|nr:hypothetical protein BX616_003724 [Lobosporangium transversale]
MSHPAFLWNTLGVPVNQWKMILDEGTTARYFYDTLDLVMERSLFRNDQYFYYMIIVRKYTREPCPSNLTEANAEEETREVCRTVRKGGMVLWRSAGPMPWCNAMFEKHEFTVETVDVRIPGSDASVGRTNRYASWYKAIKQ